jgi:formate-dependent nitrite reductase membrane component NrfD
VLLGALVPLLLQQRVIGPRAARLTALRAILVLAGGFLVKFVIVSAGQAS